MFVSGQEIFVSKMLIKEYRIPLPMSVEEYRIAQLYMIQVRNVLLPARLWGLSVGWGRIAAGLEVLNLLFAVCL